MDKCRIWSSGNGNGFIRGYLTDEALLLTTDGKWMSFHHHCMDVNPSHENYQRKYDFNDDLIREDYTDFNITEKEVYVGDIIEWQPSNLLEPLRGSVSYNKKMACYLVNNTMLWELIDPKVIGNIQENPELLEDK